MSSLLYTLVLSAAAVSALPQIRPGLSSAPRAKTILARTEHHSPRPFHVRQNDVNDTTPHKLIPVVVGGPQDTFVPNSVTANVGDVIQFQFSNGNHTVTESAADTPCAPLVGGVHSGHIPFATGDTVVGTFNMPVLSTEPLYLYCATGPHCLEGQVMVLNPANIQQVVDYSKLAMQQPANIDGDQVIGGTVGEIPFESASFEPAPEDAGGPPPGAPPAEEPVAEEPVAEEPVAEEPVAEEPVAEEPVAEEPAVADPAAETTPVEAAPVVEGEVPTETASSSDGIAAPVETPAAVLDGDTPVPQGIFIVSVTEGTNVFRSISVDPSIVTEVVPAFGGPQRR